MIKLPKKSGSARSYNWRPNFRDLESLPESRVVRTRFFLPTFAVVVASLFSAYILFQEYRAMRIGEDIKVLEAEIATHEERHDEKVKYNAEFMEISRRLSEVVEFKQGRLVASDLLLSLSSRLLDGMYLEQVDYMEGRANIQGNVLVSAEEASRLVNEYLKSIEEADVMQGLLDEYKLTSLERAGAGTGIVFRIEVTKKEEKK